MRTCGLCVACCFFTKVADSSAYSLCEHCVEGCDIYETRPEACKNFKCLWLRQEQVPFELRPDKCGVMFEVPYGSDVCIGHVDPANLKAWGSPEVQLFIKKINEFGHSVVIYRQPMTCSLTEGDSLERVKSSVHNARELAA